MRVAFSGSNRESCRSSKRSLITSCAFSVSQPSFMLALHTHPHSTRSVSIPRKHLAHCCLACMYISCNYEKYEELRKSYNSVIDVDGVETKRIPPVDEFGGMDSICSSIFCKWVPFFSWRSLCRIARVVFVVCYLRAVWDVCGGDFARRRCFVGVLA